MSELIVSSSRETAERNKDDPISLHIEQITSSGDVNIVEGTCNVNKTVQVFSHPHLLKVGSRLINVNNIEYIDILDEDDLEICVHFGLNDVLTFKGDDARKICIWALPNIII